jgi:tetratricopeptide (TPR) repeat protein
MRIIGTSKFRKKLSAIGYQLSALLLFMIVVFSGCAQKGAEEQAKDYIKQSQASYEQAVSLYKNLIKEGKNLNQLHYELGRLYYDRSDFQKAIEEFDKTSEPLAKKYTGISLFKSADFMQALSIFSQNALSDAEYLYYYGLTCEKLNLFDKALDIYGKIKDENFRTLALSRINTIVKETGQLNIKDVSPKTYEIIQNAPSQDLYPQAGALVLHCDEKIEITGQDTKVTDLHYVVKILNERGKENFSETQIEYDSTFEKVELEFARTIKPDGTVVEVGSRHIRDVSKYLNFPLYSNVRVYIISFPEIAEGACVEYKLKIFRNELINKNDFALNYPVQASEPIINASFAVSIPEARGLNIKILNERYNDFNADVKPQIIKEGGKLLYLWKFKDIPQIIPESNMPPEVEINPTMLISTFKSWQDIYQWWWPLVKDKINADEAIRAKVRELTGGLKEEEDKARALYNFCAKEVRYVAVEYGEAGYEPHKAEDIFRNKYGDCKDQAVLLVAMLKEAGIRAYPVLIPTKGYYNLNNDFPSVLFDHSIAALNLGDKLIFLDPTAETCSFKDLPAGDQDRMVLVVKEDGYEIEKTPFFPAGQNFLKQNISIKINANETISAKKEILVQGMYEQAQRYWLLYTPPQLIEESLKERIQEVSIGATLKNYKIENANNLDRRVVLSYSFEGPEYFTAAGNLRIMPQLSGMDVSLVAKDKRKYPIDFGILDERETALVFEIPKEFMIKYVPETVTEDSPWIRFAAEYAIQKNQLIFRQKIELKKNSVSQEEYADFKSFYQGLTKKIKQRVILEKIK